jgi:hypothetical protein
MQEPKNEIKASLRVFTKNSIKISFQEKTNGKFNRLISPTNIEDVINLIKYEELDEVMLCGASCSGMGRIGLPDQLSERMVLSLDMEDKANIRSYSTAQVWSLARYEKGFCAVTSVYSCRQP